jgi:serine-type D-Ala-D-Ala carboxypeptidase/endopeptidase (penicillin-binding protein 4)
MLSRREARAGSEPEAADFLGPEDEAVTAEVPDGVLGPPAITGLPSAAVLIACPPAGRRHARRDRRQARLGSRRWLLGPALLLAVAAVSGVVAVRSERATGAMAPRGGPRAVTPVLAARRAPEVIAAPVAGRRLTAALDGIVTRLPQNTCMAVSGPSGPIYLHNATTPVVPASNQKLDTAFAALTKLGPDAAFTTAVVATATPVGGVVAGDLYLVGGGDPILMSSDFAAHFKYQPVVHTDYGTVADAIAAAGITAVQGRILGDESRYDRLRAVPAWPQRFLDQNEAGPLSALEVNHGFASFPPTPDASAPPLTPAADPAAHAAGILTGLLQARGIAVGGPAGSAAAPAGAVPLAHVDSPVSKVLTEMLQESDNSTAELVTKELGQRFGGAGTTAAGVAVIRSTLTDARIPLDGVTFVDGSGLAENSDHTTCVALTAVLAAAATLPLAGDLPVAGQSGTLQPRFGGTPAAGRLQAKTGTLSGVVALSGYAHPPDGPPLDFAIVTNSTGSRLGDREVALVDSLAVALMSYPDTPDLTALGPKAPA